MQFELSAVTNWFNSKNFEDCTVYLASRGNIDNDPGPRTEKRIGFMQRSTAEGTLRARNWGPSTTTGNNAI